MNKFRPLLLVLISLVLVSVSCTATTQPPVATGTGTLDLSGVEPVGESGESPATDPGVETGIEPGVQVRPEPTLAPEGESPTTLGDIETGEPSEVVDTAGDVGAPADPAGEVVQPVAGGPVGDQLPQAHAAAFYPADMRTGDAALDAIIDAVIEHGMEAVRGLTQYTVVGCTQADGLGGPPKCEASEAEGTLVEVVPIMGPEGHHMRRAEYEAWPGPEVRGLLAVYRVDESAYSDPAYPAGEFGIVFLGPQDMIYVTLQVTEGRILRFDFGFGSSPASDITNRAAEMILPPFGTQTPAPVEVGTATLLESALVGNDFLTLESLMGEDLVIGYWRSEGLVLSPAEAIEELRLNLLPDPAGISFIQDRSQFPDLGGLDPSAAFGPEVQIVDLVYSQGWGHDGLGEAILTLAIDSNGREFWQGIIYSFAGFG